MLDTNLLAMLYIFKIDLDFHIYVYGNQLKTAQNLNLQS